MGKRPADGGAFVCFIEFLRLLHLDRYQQFAGRVLTSSISLPLSLASEVVHSAARPFPTKPACWALAGTPGVKVG